MANLESALTEARSALDSDNVDVVKAASGKLEQAAHKLAETMYAAGGAQEAGGGAPAVAGGRRDDVIDAEFSVS